MRRPQDEDQSGSSEESYPSWQEYFPKQPHNQPNHLLMINQTIFADLGIAIPPEAFASVNRRNDQEEEDEAYQNSSREQGYEYSEYQIEDQPSDYGFTPASEIEEDQDDYQEYSQNHSQHFESEQHHIFDNIDNPFARRQPRNPTMSPQQIALLPVIPWTDTNPTEQCSICMQPFIQGQILRVMPCLHRNHTHCIDPWLTTNATCPSCRAPTK